MVFTGIGYGTPKINNDNSNFKNIFSQDKERRKIERE